MSVMSWFYSLTNPSRFLAFSQRLMPFAVVATVVLLGWGLYDGLFLAPPDYQQGEAVRIMYLHVPAAWLAMGCYALMASAAIGTLVFRHPLADCVAEAAAPLGAAFTLIALVSGALWGKPMWGTWWVWDARLTSVLVLFLMYLGLIALRQSLPEPTRASRILAILILVGLINLPIIKFSVDWWNTLHQPASVIRLDGPKIHPDMLQPLLVSALGFSCLFGVLLLMGIRNALLKRKIATALALQSFDEDKNHAV